MEDRGGISAAIALAFATIVGVYINYNVPDECKEAFPDLEIKGKYINAVSWIDKDLAPQIYKSISKAEQAPKLYVVSHHTAGDPESLARELCEFTNNRFGTGCSYVISIHENGNVIQMSDIDEYTASVKGMNSAVISIVYVGNFENRKAPDIMLYRGCQIKSAFEKLDAKLEDFEIEAYTYHGQHTATKCPGKELRKQLIEHGLVEAD